ncbi:hypothetical protein M434DRAFT_35090 [Hypoxylon sp. CO27-5]|nr:hypothetical protein M434DRAFT_35090 [Hypoxylon sp. CO27-5]
MVPRAPDPTSAPPFLAGALSVRVGTLAGMTAFFLSYFHHICRSSHHLKGSNTIHNAFYFWIYQTGRHGPQNGFRLCLVNRGYHIGPDEQSHPDKEDDIDLLEKPIPQGHIELAILGEPPPIPDGLEDDASSNDSDEPIGALIDRLNNHNYVTGNVSNVDWAILPNTAYDEVYVVPAEKPTDTSHPA